MSAGQVLGVLAGPALVLAEGVMFGEVAIMVAVVGHGQADRADIRRCASLVWFSLMTRNMTWPGRKKLQAFPARD